MCYNYAQLSFFREKYILKITEIPDNEQNYTVLYSIVNGTDIYYDYKNKTFTDVIRLSFKAERYYNKWVECSKEAENCCENFMNSENVCPSK